MKEIAYIIDKDLSLAHSQLVIKISLADRESYYLKIDDKTRSFSLNNIEKYATAQDKLALNFLIKEEIKTAKKLQNKLLEADTVPLQSLRISKLESIQALKLMAATGKLFFNDKPLVADFYGKADFNFSVDVTSDNKICLSGHLKWSDHKISLSDCDLLLEGPPHFFIKGCSLKLIGGEVTFSNLKKCTQNNFQCQLSDIKALQEAHLKDPNEPKVDFLNNSRFKFQRQADPIPFLVLKDKSGAFADLWIDDGKQKLPLHDLSKKWSEAEKALEKDLLESDFKPKQMAGSHYYCPLDKVFGSLTFILEIGWKIFDFKGRELIPYENFEIHFNKNNQLIEAKGHFNFRETKVNLSDVITAFKKRESFISISENSVGLIPRSFENKDLQIFMEISEVVADNVCLKTCEVGQVQELLESNPSTLDDKLTKMLDHLKNSPLASLAKPSDIFLGVLRPYQQEGVHFLKFLYDFQFCGMLADDMGLGKTVQVLAFLSQIKSDKPTLIVLPASLVFNWRLEIKRFTPKLNVSIHHGKTRDQILDTKSNIILTTYNLLRQDLELFRATAFECVILDEAQTIKNASTQTAIACCSLKSNFRLSITGTPIENHLKEIWSHFRFLMPELLGAENRFLEDLQAADADSRALQKIKKKIRPFILRRKKEEVAKDLPECIEQTLFVEMAPAQRKIYDDYLNGIKNSLVKKIDVDGLSKHRMEILEAILRLRQICCHPLLVSDEASDERESAKLEMLLDDIETAISEGRKILVYSQFTSMLQLIAKAVKKKGYNHAYLDGSTQNREKIVADFQENPAIPLFLISLKAGGVGLNLTAADYVFLYDPWWNDAVENQAISRAHRIGRQNSVVAKRYIMAETIEEKIMQIKSRKTTQALSILDDELAETAFTEEDFRFLLS